MSKPEKPEYELCDVGVGFDLEENERGSFEVKEEGHKCYNDAVGKFEIEVHPTGTMEFWLCETHLEEEREEGNVVKQLVGGQS